MNPLSEFSKSNNNNMFHVPTYIKPNKLHDKIYNLQKEQRIDNAIRRIKEEKQQAKDISTLFSNKEPTQLGMFNQSDKADAYIKRLINRQKWTRERFTSEDLIRMLKTEFPNSSIHRIETPENRVARIIEEVEDDDRRIEQLKSATGLDIGRTRGGYKKRHRKSRRTRSKSRKRRSHRRR